MRHLLLLLVPLLFSACPPPRPPPTDVPLPLPLDAPLPEGRARCGLVTRPNELIGGPTAYTEVGKSWRCYNTKVRFGGSTRDGAVGLALSGGSLLDADVMRGDEAEPGEDLIREVFPAPGFLGVDVQNVEVLKDGEDGGDAVIRVSGRSMLLGVLPQVVLVQQIYQGDVVTDFILHPEAEYLEMTTTVFNQEARAINIMLGDFLSFGSAVRAFTPESGFGEAPLFASVSIYAGASRNISYAYTVREGRFTLPVVDAGGTGAMVKLDAVISDQESFTRFLAVGRRGLASALSVANELRGEPQGTLRVHLTHGGQPVAGTVTLYLFGSANNAPAANQVVVAESGSVEERVLAGRYRFKALGAGTLLVSSTEELVITAGQTSDITVALDERAQVTVQAHEVSSGGMDLGPVPAKLSVVRVAAPAADPDMQPESKHNLATYVVAANGLLSTSLPPGTYRFLVSRGPEYSLFTHETTLTSGQELTLDAPLKRVVTTENLLAAEFHQHTLGSLDSPTDVPTKVLENAAEGVELAACTDHDNVKDYGVYVDALGLAPFFQGWAGNEISYNGVGHFNAYPLDINENAPFKDVGARLWAGRSVTDLLAWLRARPEDPVVHVSHPRDTGGKGYFARIRLNPVTGAIYGQSGPILGTVPEGTLTTFAQDFDALEVNSDIAEADLLEPASDAELTRRAEHEPSTIPTMVDWFHLLLTGHHVAALGNSDSHVFNDGSGWPRNYLLVDDDRPNAVTRDDVRLAIRNQRGVVSNGLLVVPRVDGVIRLGRTDAVPVNGQVSVELRIQSAAWLGGASRLTIFANGRPLHVRLDGTTLTPDVLASADNALTPGCDEELCQLTLTLTITPTQDTWLVFVARGEGTPAPVGSGSVYGYTNPVYLDVGGNGFSP